MMVNCYNPLEYVSAMWNNQQKPSATVRFTPGKLKIDKYVIINC